MMRASDHAYETLLREIQSGHLPPGTVLAEAEQAERLGVSRTPLREALTRLAGDRLVEQASPRVTVVTDINTDDIRALFTVRRALEETAASLAASSVCRHPSRADPFVHLVEAFDQTSLEGDGGHDDYYALIADFDRAVDAAADNDYLVAALRTVRMHLVRVRLLARQHPDRLAASVSEHALIARAIAEGNNELAAHATHVHLHNALTSILASLPSEHLHMDSTPEPSSHSFALRKGAA